MGKFDGVLLVSDFDGTLCNSFGEISDDVVASLRFFIDEGGLFTVSTGRSKQGFHAYSSDIINAPVLLANGAFAFDYRSGSTVYSDGIHNADIKLFAAAMKKYSGMSIEFYTDDCRTFVVSPDERSRKHFDMQYIDYTVIKDIYDLPLPVIKIMIGAGKKTLEVQEHLKNCDLGNIKFIPCNGAFIELLSVSAGKGSGMLRLADILGISHDRVFAVGDGSNDVDMLTCAAEGFVPENGDPLALAVAGTVVKSNDRGAVADVISILDKRFG